MDNLMKISDSEAFRNAQQGQAMMVFSTTWCPDCHFLKTFINDLVKDNPEWTFYYIDRDEMMDLCIDLEIMGIPSFIAYKNDQEVSRLVNKSRKTQSEIQAFIDAIE